MQRLLLTSGFFDRRGHLGKDVNVGAAKSIDRLFAIANDEQISPAPQRQLRHEVALQAVGILKLIDEEIPIAFGDPTQDVRTLQELQSAQLQIVEIKH